MHLLALILGMLYSTFAVAGTDGHGGDVVYCPGKKPVVLDYYQASQRKVGNPNMPRLYDVDNKSYDEVLEYIENILKPYYEVWLPYEKAKEVIGEIDDWSNAPLPDTGDANQAYNLQPGCYKRRAVNRQNDVMYGNEAIIHSLSEGQKALLVVHERLYYASGAKTSERVRVLVRKLLDLDASEVSVRKAILNLFSDHGLNKLMPPTRVFQHTFLEFGNEGFVANYKLAHLKSRNDISIVWIDYNKLPKVTDPRLLPQRLDKICKGVWAKHLFETEENITGYLDYEYAMAPNGFLYFKSFKCIFNNLAEE